MFGSKSGQFDRYLERATSQLLLEPDWDSILQICDSIRQNDVQSKYAVTQMRKKVSNDNPHVSMFALQVLESVVKNCGSSIHEEVANKEFMEFFKEQVKRPDPVKGKISELIQVWSHAFRNEASYKIVQDTFHLMKMEGYQFPALKEADAMFMAEKAPEWKDGETCHRCRVQFSTFQRKHHCRNCGQVFCNKCSSKTSIIPRFGIEREVRVCDACFDTLNKGAASSGKKDEDLPAEYLSSPLSQQPQQTPAKKSEEELREEEELQLALALSMSEAAEKEKMRERMRPGFTGGNSNTSNPAPAKDTNNMYSSQKLSGPTGLDTSDMDPELARYLNRNYWEQKQEEIKTTPAATATSMNNSTQPSAPAAQAELADGGAGKENENYHQNGETTSQASEDEVQFLNALNGSIQIFVNRMKSNSMRGRSIANDSSVQTLFMTLNTMHPQLMTYIQKQEERRAYYEALQDKLAQLKDAREALNDLREEHRERRRREQEELERQRQIAMAARLEKLRQKKQEYLEYQRQLAMQRMQEQEREMALRLEQQKQMQHMRAMQYSTMQPPQMQPQMQQQMYPGAATFSPGGSAEGSPHHQQYNMPPGGYQSLPPQQQLPQQPPQYSSLPPTSMPQQGYPYPQQAPPMGMPPAGAPPGGYPGAPPPQQGQPPPDFYNMQGMAGALPGGMQQQQQQPPPPQQQPGQMPAQQPGQMPPQQQQADQFPPQQQYAPMPGQPQQPPPQQPAPPQQQQQQGEGQLICFD